MDGRRLVRHALGTGRAARMQAGRPAGRPAGLGAIRRLGVGALEWIAHWTVIAEQGRGAATAIPAGGILHSSLPAGIAACELAL